MRVSKLPEVRKQEIIDIAIQVFTEKGYEHTTMRDIAAAVQVAPGLCYRYFDSKEELFNIALQQYVSVCCAPMVKTFKKNSDDLNTLMKDIGGLFVTSEGNEKYHTFFHKQENKNFHILLNYQICEYMQPYVKEFLDHMNEKKILNIKNTTALSQFAVHGQIAIINDETLSNEEKAQEISNLILKLLQ